MLQVGTQVAIHGPWSQEEATHEIVDHYRQALVICPIDAVDGIAPGQLHVPCSRIDEDRVTVLKVPCPCCGGSGQIHYGGTYFEPPDVDDCPVCEGLGKLSVMDALYAEACHEDELRAEARMDAEEEAYLRREDRFDAEA